MRFTSPNNFGKTPDGIAGGNRAKTKRRYVRNLILEKYVVLRPFKIK